MEVTSLRRNFRSSLSPVISIIFCVLHSVSIAELLLYFSVNSKVSKSNKHFDFGFLKRINFSEIKFYEFLEF